MSEHTPPSLPELLEWTWSNLEPYYKELAERSLTAKNVEEWLADWSFISHCNNELYNRLNVATTVNTADQRAKTLFNSYMDETYPRVQAAEQALKTGLLSSGLCPAGFDIPLRNMRAESELFREENLPLLGESEKLGNEYDRIMGAQVVQWEGKEYTISQMQPLFQDSDRSVRERAWHLMAERQLADRQILDTLWQKLLDIRLQIAANAGCPDFRAWRWRERLRFDYTPQDCRKFQDAIEEVVVPAASRILKRRRQRLGLSALRPWDLNVDPWGLPPLRPFQSVAELQSKASMIFHRVDADLGGYFDTMQKENLLDLDNRKHKAPGAYCTDFGIIRRPFVFANSVGIHNDVSTILHESGHAFHVFEMAQLPYVHQLNVPMEFAEVASMAMELLASPYLAADHGGFYNPANAARAMVEKLEEDILFWPYMAVVDAFQHWVYENPQKSNDPSQCDACWADLWRRFKPGVDWSGLEDVMVTGWHRKLHIFKNPFYYVEYGLAQLGAVQIWHNSLKDQAGTVASYRKALSLGGTVTLPQLFETAGARLSFDAGALRQAVNLMEETIVNMDLLVK